MLGPMMRKVRGQRRVREGYWFAPRKFGLGAVPATWQGWLATAIFLLLLGLAIAVVPTDTLRIAAAMPIVVLFIWITWVKTDGGWRWRWGPDRD